jgi:hypothetical protein
MAAEAPLLEEGWYLMTTAELEVELGRRRGRSAQPSGAIPLSIQEALVFRNAGNLPDDGGRTLRLVLHIDPAQPGALEKRRLELEPDYHDAPDWRRDGSVPVNVVPIRIASSPGRNSAAWWEDPALAALEREWREHGTVEGLSVPGPYRGFVYKTVLALKEAGLPVSASAVADSIARWLPGRDAAEIRAALLEATENSGAAPS